MDAIAAAVAPLVKRSWVARATVVRPGGAPVFDPSTGTYTNSDTTIATGVACALMPDNASRMVDVAGDPQTLTRLRLEHDPAVTLQLDDKVTFTTHPDTTVQGVTFRVVEVGAVDRATFGLATVQRLEPDSGA